jgi:hypothetical protein
MHSWRARRRGLGWIGIALILLNLCAPALTHALQGPAREALTASAHSADWCGGAWAPGSLGATPITGSGNGPEVPGSPGQPGAACGFCAQVSLGWSLPVAPLARLELAPADPGRPATQRPTRTATVPRTGGQPRAPPVHSA